MLQELRKLSKSWVSSIFLGALALSFGVWGIADIFRGGSDTSIATVGGEAIPYELFQRDYRNFLTSASNRAGHPITADEARSKGLDRQALETEISRTAVDQIISRYGLTATDAQISSAIRRIQAFKGPLGSFDHTTFLDVIGRSNYTEDSFIAVERHDLARSQLLTAINGGPEVPTGYALLFFNYINGRRAVDYMVVPPDAIGAVPAPNDVELETYIKAHNSQFSTPEYRDVSYAVAGPDDVMNRVKVTEDQLKQQYELRKDQYQIPEKRDVEQMTFKDEASAKAARAKIDAGTNFADLATMRGLTPSDISLGTVVQDDLGKDRGPPTFALPANGVTQPVKFTFGWVLLHVSKVTPGVNQSFDSVKEALRKEIVNQLASAKLTDVSNAFDDASAGGANLADAAARAGMHFVHIAAVDKNGLGSDGSKTNLPTVADFRAQLLKSDVGEEGDPFPASDGNIYVIKVNGITPPKLKSLASVRTEATAAWTAEQQHKRLADKAQALVAQASADGSLVKIASLLHTSTQSSGSLSRSSTSGILSDTMVQKIFQAPPGGVVAAPAAQGGGYVVARVSGISYPSDSTKNPYFQGFVQSLSQQIGWGNDLVEAFANAARDEAGVKINQNQVNQITGGS